MPPEGYVNPRSARGNQGCWSCRFRKKKCQRSDANDLICDDCRRFHMECIGSGEERPRRPGISKQARDVLKEWIKAHSKEAPNPDEEPLSLRYLWETPARHSLSSQRGSQEMHVHRDHRRSASMTSTHTVSSQGSQGGSNVYGMQPEALQSLIVTNSRGSGEFSTLPSNHTHTANMRHPHRDTAIPGNVQQAVHPAYAGYPSYPSQSHSSDGAMPRCSTSQIQNESVAPSGYLTVPGLQGATRQQPQVNLVFTDEQGTPFDPNAATPLVIPNWHETPFPASPVSSTFLSPSSPYASSILSSSSSMDDGSWDQGPPSPGYFTNDLFTDANQTSTTVVTSGQGLYYQPQSPTYPR